MCGFIGIVSLEKLNRSNILDRKFDKAYSFLKPRGPDEKGIYIDEQIYFLHTRTP